MKMSSILTIIGLTIASGSAQAFEVLNCTSSATNHAFNMYIQNQNVIQIRIRVNSHREKALTPHLGPNQSVEGYAVYFIQDMPGDFEVENSILAGSRGTARLAGEEFSCQ